MRSKSGAQSLGQAGTTQHVTFFIQIYGHDIERVFCVGSIKATWILCLVYEIHNSLRRTFCVENGSSYFSLLSV